MEREEKIRWRWAAASSLFSYAAMILAFLSPLASVPLALLGVAGYCFKRAVKGLVRPFFRSLLGV